MKKVFLSHSSKDKEFVRRVAEIIGLNFCVIDECEFEIGMKNIDEIFKGIEKSDIFVYFISQFSLESVWVKEELNIACDKISNFSEKKIQIYPIIIDTSINHTDKRIADYLRIGKGSYNLRHILKPEIAARKIRTQLIKLEMLHDRKFEEDKNYFYGRDEEKLILKQKIDDVLNSSGLRCLVASGIPGIGRKSFVNSVLKDAGIIERYYFPIVVTLEREESIDNLLRLLNNIGIGKYTLDELSKLTTMDEKISTLVEMMLEIQNYQEFLIIEDNACIVKLNGSMAFWFEKALSQMKSRLNFAVVSEVRLDEFKYRKSNLIAHIVLNELSKSDTLGMLRTYSKMQGIPFEKEDREYFSNCLSGYPPQVEYCVDLAKANGIDFVKKNTFMIADMPEQISSKLIDLSYVNFENKKDINCILALIVKFGTMPVSLLNEVMKIKESYREAFYKIRALSICYYVGSDKEYVKLNSFLHSFVERCKFDVAPDVQELILKNISEFEEKINDDQYTDELDYSEVNYYVKELLKLEKIVPQRFLYGTVFLQSIISLYNTRQYNKVIRIVRGLLEDNQILMYEREVEKRIMYFYCLALARKKSGDFDTVVSFFADEEGYVNYNFLQGYHCRILGDFKKAENYYHNVFKRDPRNMKTRRELVFIYISNQQYEIALDLAKSSYKQNRNNIHYMQAYFDCLIYKRNCTEEEKKDMEEIVDTVKTVYKQIKLSGMYYQILAKYEAFNNNNKEEALKYILEGLEKIDDDVISYLLKEKFDVYEHFGDLKGMEATIDELTNELQKQEIDDMRLNNILICRKALLLAHKGKPFITIQMEVLQNTALSDNARTKIMNNVEKVLNGKSIMYEL